MQTIAAQAGASAASISATALSRIAPKIERGVDPAGLLKIGGKRARAVGVVRGVEEHLGRSIREALEAARPAHLGQPGADRRIGHAATPASSSGAQHARRDRGVAALMPPAKRQRRRADPALQVARSPTARISGAPRSGADRRDHPLGLGRQLAADQRARPALTMPAFSKAIDSSVLPSCAWWSKPIEVIAVDDGT